MVVHESGRPGRRPVAGVTGRHDFARHVRDALHHLHDLISLQTNPLTSYVSREPGARTGNLGKSLQKAVLEAIESLKPADPSQSSGRSARTYQILTLRYVQGLDLAEVLEQLGVGESEYHRSQRRALEAVALVLGERWGEGATAPVDDEAAAPPVVTLPTAARSSTPRSFPLSLTSFVGRARELAAILPLVRSSRLVTLTGPPGAGKTRVAQAVAEALRADFGEERAFVALGPIEDPQLVLPAIAKGLGISEAGGRAVLDALIDGIGTRRIFLVLDNVEHVLAAAPLVAEVIAACPQLTVLATSRSPLKVHGEREFAIAPLEVPDLWQPSSPAELASVASVALFLDRARAVSADFELTVENSVAIGEICVRLDGIPLAIELAAARTKALAPSALLARLAATGKTELRLLNRGLRDLPARQQTMWAAIDWSYDLLAPVERLVFRRLSIFSGSFSLEAAEGIVSPTLASARLLAVDEQLAPETILVDVVSALVDQSLLLPTDAVSTIGSAEQRFQSLGLVRSYARERLAEHAEEWELMGRQHAAWYVALAEQAESELRGAGQASWFERLEREHDNLRAALGWCLENDVVAGLRAAASLWRFWWLRGHHHEGRRWLDLLLAAPIPALSGEAATAAVVTRARALHGAGFVAFQSGDRRAKPLLEESQALMTQIGRRNGTGDTLRLLGRLAFEEGSLSQARVLMEESLASLRETGAPPGSHHGAAGTLYLLATLEWTEGNLTRARELAEESLRIFREVRDPHGAGWALVFLGQLARTSGDFPTAVKCLKGSLTAFQMVGHRVGIGWALGRLGAMALKTGDLDEASTLLEQSLSMFREGAYQPNLSRAYSEEAGVSWTLGYLGYLALSKGDTARARSLLQESLSLLREFPEHESDYWSRFIFAFGLLTGPGDQRRVARLLAAISTIHPALLTVLDPIERASYDSAAASARAELGDAAFEQAWAEGASFTLEQAADEALRAL